MQAKNSEAVTAERSSYERQGGTGAGSAADHDADLSPGGFLETFFDAGSPDFIFREVDGILSGYHALGQIVIAESRPGRMAIRITGSVDLSQEEEAKVGEWMLRTFESRGYRHVRSQIVKSVTKGDPYTEYVLCWK